MKEAAVRHGPDRPSAREGPGIPSSSKSSEGFAPDMVVLVAFGQILPKEIIDGPHMGCVNVHPSLLPKYRGAAPMNWALIRGEEKTGISIMRMDEGVDSGDILLQEETAIEPGETYDHLHDRLAALGARCLLRTLEGLAMRKRSPNSPGPCACHACAAPQEGRTALIRWESPGPQTSPTSWPASLRCPERTPFFGGKVLKVYSAESEEAPVA
ncbi:MAG: methionyl-tRNA formyltransferase [Desulfosudis oleivorans]|nr:methionyl-tRNA formyltransferase [Desulfosudis oleivorans]